MTNNHHTPIPSNAAANVASVNTPLGQLDEAITNLSGIDFTTISTGTPVITDNLAFEDIDDSNTTKKTTIQTILNLITAGGLVPLQNTTLLSSANNIQFSTIPGTYAYLKIIGQLRSDRGSNAADNISMQFNSDTGATSYRFQTQRLSGVTAGVDQDDSHSSIDAYLAIPATSASSGYFAPVEITIFNYANISQYRHVSILSNYHDSATARVTWSSGIWKNTANAITDINIFPAFGTNFITGSRLTLYGLAEVS